MCVTKQTFKYCSLCAKRSPVLSKIPVQTFKRKAALKAVNFPSCSGGGSGDPAAEPSGCWSSGGTAGKDGIRRRSLAMTRLCGANKATAALEWE